MPIKRLNFTDRQKVARKKITLELLTNGASRSLSVHFNFAEMGLNPDAEVILEAMSAGSKEVTPISCGYVRQWDQATGEPPEPQRILLDGIDDKGLFFRLHVVDQTEHIGRIIAFANDLRPLRGDDPSDERNRDGILPMAHSDLGDELWRLQFWGNSVHLLVNKDVEGLYARFSTDPLFYTIVYPEIIRQVLFQVAIVGVESDDDTHWTSQWVRFGMGHHSEQAKPPEELLKDDAEHWEEWINDVVRGFCTNQDMKTRYLNALLTEAEA